MLFSLLLATAALADDALADDAEGSWLNAADRPYDIALSAELGFLAPVAHTIQFSRDGTRFDYVADGGQDLLFAFTRLSADLYKGRHSVTLLYQPIEINTQAVLQEDLIVDGQLFPAGTPMAFRYSFPFYRASYLYDLSPREDREVGVGLSLQIRDARIDFESLDGTMGRSNGGIGPVPVLKARFNQEVGENGWVGAEADGFYAPVSYLNGDNNDIIGAILDASLRAGLRLDRGISPFVNLRYLGGGAQGEDDDYDGYGGDGYTENWLHFVTVSGGVTLR